MIADRANSLPRFSFKLLSTYLSFSSLKPPEACYSYRPLDQAKGEIRVLTVRHNKVHGTLFGTLRHVPLDDRMEYAALSYTWGGQKASCTITIDGATLNITPNLAAALKCKSISDLSIPIWADAICINQQDIEERNRQVLRMRQIYSQAWWTYVWLGEEANNSSVALDMLSEAQNGRAIDGQKFQKHWQSFYRLLNRPWWGRVWVIQEAVVSRAVDFVCGDKRIYWYKDGISGAVAKIRKVVESERSQDTSAEKSNALQSLHRLESMAFLQRFWEKNGFQLHRRPLRLLTALELSRDALASDPRDKIYGLLDLALDGPKLIPQPDYTISKSLLYRSLVRSYVALYNDIEILCHAGNTKSDPDIPTWTPDWSDSNYGGSIRRAGSSGSFGRFRNGMEMMSRPVISSDLTTMTVRGVCIGTISTVEGIRTKRSEMSTASNPYGTNYGTMKAILHCISTYSSRTMDSDCYSCCINSQLCRDFSKTCQASQTGFNGRSGIHDPLREWYQSNKHFKIQGRTLEDLIATECPLDENSMAIPIDVFRRYFVESMRRRKLFTTINGHVGVGRESIMEADLMCLLPGCSVPMVLRQQDDVFEVVGDAYVMGYMQGEFKDHTKTLETDFQTLNYFCLV